MTSIIHRLAKLNWVVVILSPLMVIMMEVCWVYPWLVWAGKWQVLVWQRPPLHLISLIFLFSVSFFVTRVFLSRQWSLIWIQVCIVSCGLVAICTVVRVEYAAGFGLLNSQWFVHTTQIILDSFSHPHPLLIALIAAAYLWWRGIILGRLPQYFGDRYSNDIYRSFLVGMAALVVLLLIWGSDLGTGSQDGQASTIGLYVAGFFFFGLTALALINLQTIRRKMLHEETAVFSRHWLGIPLGVTGGIVLVGIGIASIFSFEFAALLARLWNLTSEVLLQGLYYLLIPLGYLVAGLVYVIQFMVSFLHQEKPQPFQTIDFSEPENVLEEGSRQLLSPEAILAIKWTFFALLAILVLFLLAKAISRYRSSRSEVEIEEIHESLWSWQGFKADVRLFFSMIWQRFRRKRKERVKESSLSTWHPKEDVQARLDIREIYRHLLWKASCSKMARHPHETPYEYARRLGQAMPNGNEQLSRLTNLYIDVRYGDLEAKDKQVDYANGIWKFLQRLLAKLERSQAE
ncbi:DUF4129 domain-containing protein [Chloroflexota bacterium]